MLHVTEIQVVSGYTLWLRFSDGVEGSIDLGGELDGEIFEPLRDTVFFSKVVLDPELGTIAWPNGADFAPEFLQSLIQSSTTV